MKKIVFIFSLFIIVLLSSCNSSSSSVVEKKLVSIDIFDKLNPSSPSVMVDINYNEGDTRDFNDYILVRGTYDNGETEFFTSYKLKKGDETPVSDTSVIESIPFSYNQVYIYIWIDDIHSTGCVKLVLLT